MKHPDPKIQANQDDFIKKCSDELKAFHEQLFQFIDQAYLKTVGKHPNPQIGEYILKISV